MHTTSAHKPVFCQKWFQDTFVFPFQEKLRDGALAFCGGNEAMAADLVQETFLSAWQGIKEFRSGSEPYAWLNKLMSKSFAAAMDKANKIDEENISSRGNTMIVDPDQFIHVQCREYFDAIGRVKFPFREVVYLAEVEGLSAKELANTLSLSELNVKARLGRARDNLKEMGIETHENYGPKRSRRGRSQHIIKVNAA